MVSTHVKSVADISSEQNDSIPRLEHLMRGGGCRLDLAFVPEGGHSLICVIIFCGGEGKVCHPFVWRGLAAGLIHRPEELLTGRLHLMERVVVSAVEFSPGQPLFSLLEAYA